MVGIGGEIPHLCTLWHFEGQNDDEPLELGGTAGSPRSFKTG